MPADNPSTDNTMPVARRLADELAGVDVTSGRHGSRSALYAARLASPADVVAYLDTDLSALILPVAPRISADADVANGSR